jgi:hypothetical protein
MSRPQFLADHDVDDRILSGLQGIEPLIDLIRAREVGLASVPDGDVLDYAACHKRIVISHDENTMIAAAVLRLRAGLPMLGLLIVPRRTPIGRAVDEWDNMVQFVPM